MKVVRDRVYKGDPFADGDFSDVRPSLQGWRSRHAAFDAVMAANRPKRIIEVGVWMGKAIVHMSRLAKSLGIEDVEILAVDTWLGSPEHWINEKWHESLRIEGGYPSIYKTFAANMIAQKLTDIVTPLPVPAETASVILTEFGVKADLVHLDAGHEYESVLADIRNFWPLVAEDGVIIGDDYLIGTYPGVEKAFKEYAAEHGLALIGTKGKCILSREPVSGLEGVDGLDILETFAPGEVTPVA